MTKLWGDVGGHLQNIFVLREGLRMNLGNEREGEVRTTVYAGHGLNRAFLIVRMNLKSQKEGATKTLPARRTFLSCGIPSLTHREGTTDALTGNLGNDRLGHW
jgi:hypothetical protein